MEINDPQACQSCNGETVTSLISAPRSRNTIKALSMPCWVAGVNRIVLLHGNDG